jgi:hypothetical protein
MGTFANEVAGGQPIWPYQMPPPGMVPKGVTTIASLVTAVGLGAIPAGTKLAVVSVLGGNANWRADGTNPTGSVGNPAWGTATLQFGASVLSTVKFINQSGSTATLNVQFYG